MASRKSGSLDEKTLQITVAFRFRSCYCARHGGGAEVPRTDDNLYRPRVHPAADLRESGAEPPRPVGEACAKRGTGARPTAHCARWCAGG